jgi:hypothetical protein
MNDDELNILVRQAQSHADATLAALDLGRGGQELLEEIMSTSDTPQLGSTNAAPKDPDPVDIWPAELWAAGRVVPIRNRRRLLIGVAAAAAFAAAIAGPTFALRGGDKATVTPGSHSAPPAATSSLTPGVLLDDPAWTISHVDENGSATGDIVDGEISFTSSKQELEVHWRPAKDYQDYYDDRLDVSKPMPFVLFGRTGAQFTYSKDDFAVMTPPQGKLFLEIRGQGGNKAAFAAAVAKLKQVPLDQWYAAMPASVVTPDKAAAVTEQILADIPQPAGFDPSTLRVNGAMDYYQFGATVIGKVTRAWLKDYVSARKAHDEKGMATVDKALSTNGKWKTLQKMDEEGAYSQVIREYADKVAHRQAVGDYENSL